ncbi:hypothetical protein [Aquimarina algiphila]|uniref:PKD domain-containing protein n=1 Tax=Aquimarina algiphila TaxID=2047982 RepID=A0A554VKQ1_9FLAO|nr:hypothetical protein [Aquimarina algiphila]TSE08621.1 hypothetical protein FOF46_11750 [Aquimarina algiphila]
MKKIGIWYFLILSLLLGFTSCDDETEDFDNDPKVEIVIDNKEGSAVYSFEAKTIGIDDNAQVIWSVDGKDIEGEDQQNIINQILDYLFKPGKHTICVRVITEQRTIEACAEINVDVDQNNPCPDLFFKAKRYQGPFTYKFIANFEGVENASYEWSVNGELVQEASQNDNQYLIYNFEQAGEYEVCIMTETPDCPQGVSYCKVIEVKDDNNGLCPELSFITEGNLLFANFPEMEELEAYEWFVDGQLVETESLQNQDRDDLLNLESYNPGTYTVCIKAETPDCPNGTEFCKEVVIPEPKPIDCSVFDLVNFKDKAAVAGAISITDIDPNSVVWTIDGTVITPITPRVARLTDHVTQPGKYEICYKAVSPTCGTLEKCIEIDYKG